MTFSFDTNVLIYAAGAHVGPKHLAADEMLARAALGGCVLTTQSLQEFFGVTVRKRLLPPPDARRVVVNLLRAFPEPCSVTSTSLQTAMSAAEQKLFSFWDALLLACADERGCEAVISEDMHPGAVLGRVRVVPAFDRAGSISAEADALLA